MTIAETLTALQEDITNARTAVVTKGGSVTTGGGSSQLATDIATIPTGVTPTGNISLTASTSTQTGIDVTNYATASVAPTPSESKTLTLGSSAPSTVSPSSGKLLSSVPVSLDTSVIKAENIAQGATILGIAGTHSGGGGDGAIPRYSISNGVLDMRTEDVTNSFSSITTINANGLRNAFSYNDNLTGSPTFTNLTTIYAFGFYQPFNYCTGLTGSVSFPALTTILGNSPLYGAFQYCTGITEMHMDAIEYIVRGNGTTTGCSTPFTGFCAQCTNLTKVSFHNLKGIGVSGGDSSGPTTFNTSFNGCTKLTDVDFTNLQYIYDTSSGYNMFNNCSSLGAISFPSLTVLGRQSMYSWFNNCSKLSEVRFPSLTTVNQTSFYNTFYNCGNQATEMNVYFPALTTMNGSNSFRQTFYNCKKLVNIYFNSLSTVQADSFGTSTSTYAFQSCTQSTLTIHFPAAMQSTIEAMTGYSAKFGATNSQILFDL